jgi:hypothetical protein
MLGKPATKALVRCYFDGEYYYFYILCYFHGVFLCGLVADYPSISLIRAGLGWICCSKEGGRAEQRLEADTAAAATDWNGKKNTDGTWTGTGKIYKNTKAGEEVKKKVQRTF